MVPDVGSDPKEGRLGRDAHGVGRPRSQGNYTSFVGDDAMSWSRLLLLPTIASLIPARAIAAAPAIISLATSCHFRCWLVGVGVGLVGVGLVC